MQKPVLFALVITDPLCRNRCQNGYLITKIIIKSPPLKWGDGLIRYLTEFAGAAIPDMSPIWLPLPTVGVMYKHEGLLSLRIHTKPNGIRDCRDKQSGDSVGLGPHIKHTYLKCGVNTLWHWA